MNMDFDTVAFSQVGRYSRGYLSREKFGELLEDFISDRASPDLELRVNFGSDVVM